MDEAIDVVFSDSFSDAGGTFYMDVFEVKVPDELVRFEATRLKEWMCVFTWWGILVR